MCIFTSGLLYTEIFKMWLMRYGYVQTEITRYLCTWQVIASPQKPTLPRHRSFGGLSSDGFAVPVDGSLSDSGSTVPVTPTEALFAAVNCVTAYQDATYNCYTPELQGLLASIRFNGQHSNGPHWPPVLSCAELSSQLKKHQPCRVASVTGGKMVSLRTDSWLHWGIEFMLHTCCC